MGCGESKLAVATADGILRRKKSIANGSKSARKVADGSKSGFDSNKIDEDVKVESEKKIDGAVKIESENEIQKKSDEVKTDAAAKIESEKNSDEVKFDGTVKSESEEKIAVNVESENKTEHQEEKKKSDGAVAEVQNVAKEEGVNGGAVEKQVVAGETKPEEAVANGGGIEVKQEIKPVEEKQFAGEMEVEKEDSGVNGGVVEQKTKPVEENKLVAENGEADKLKEEVPAKKEIATPAPQETNVKDVKENAADLPVKVSTAEKTEIAL